MRPTSRALLVLCVLLTGAAGRAEPLDATRLRALVADEARASIALFREFLALPNDAQRRGDVDALNEWMIAAFEARGFSARRLPTGGADALFAERRVAGPAPTVLVYLQADGQPVDPSAWAQPDPYVAVLKARRDDGTWQILPWTALDAGIDPEWRVFARSAADSKGPMTQFLKAVELLERAGQAPAFNLKVFVDTEEELGSPHLRDAIAANREALAADLLLIFDGPPHASNRPTVSLGARGIATVTLTTYGPKVAQHSGHYGNFVPNPALDLAHVLASMKDADGVVTIAGFYDGIAIDDATRAQLALVPDDEAAILGAMGLARHDAVAATLQEAIQYPSLNIRGMASAWVGDNARTIIPPTATAEIDIRLVLESDAGRLIGLLRRHIEGLGYTVLDHAPGDEERRAHPRIVRMNHEISYGAFRSDPESPPARMARAGLERLYGEEPILIRTMGGSIPIAPMIEVLGIPAATVPTVNIDNNQHSPNENLRLGSFLEGIAMLMAVLETVPGD